MGNNIKECVRVRNDKGTVVLANGEGDINMHWKDRRKHYNKWYLWFAWCPVLIGDEWYWLEYVQKMSIYDIWGVTHKYRELPKINGEPNGC